MMDVTILKNVITTIVDLIKHLPTYNSIYYLLLKSLYKKLLILVVNKQKQWTIKTFRSIQMNYYVRYIKVYQ